MVVRVDVVARALEAVVWSPREGSQRGTARRLTEAWGRPIDQRYVNEVAGGGPHDHLRTLRRRGRAGTRSPRDGDGLDRRLRALRRGDRGGGAR